MKDVAKACGVSVVTVSRVLKKDRNHSVETRERVFKMAEKLGYRPNPLVAALMSARGRHKPAKGTVNLALLNPGGNQDWPQHPFYQGVMAQAETLGFSIEMFDFGKTGGRQRLRSVFQSRGIRGVVVLPTPEADWALGFDLTGFAAATIGYSVTSPDMPRVVTDTYGRVMMALNQARERGYRRIGVLGTDDLDQRFQHLGTAASKVFAHLNPDVEVRSLNVDPCWTPGDNAAVVHAWVQQHRVDAIISQVGLYDELRAGGLDIPGAVGFVHMHLNLDTAVTCMDQNQHWIGRKTTDVVVGMINRNEFQIPEQSQIIMIPSTWVEGTTLPERR